MLGQLRLSRAFPLRRRACLPSAMGLSTKAKAKLTLEQLAERESLRGQRVLVRADLNVPLQKHSNPAMITDDTRIRAVLPTLKLLQMKGAKTILCSHLGRPDGQVQEHLRLTPVAAKLSQLLNVPIPKLDDCVGDSVDKALDRMQDCDIVLLENVRFHKEETKNDPAFAKALAHGASVFVNDAFGTAHRAHASTAGVAQHIKTCVAGSLMNKELKFLSGAIDEPKRPLGAVIGGAKVSTKLPVLRSLLTKCDRILLGGGMIFTFYKAQGLNIGKSIVEEDMVELAKEILEEAKAKGVKLLLPEDVVVADAFAPDASSQCVPADAIPDDAYGMDIGLETRCKYEMVLRQCKTIVWNGPLGVCEFPAFGIGTLTMGESIGRCTERGATTVVGGGDTVAVIEEGFLTDSFTHVSTGGGASLELMEGRVLPGVEVLQDA